MARPGAKKKLRKSAAASIAAKRLAQTSKVVPVDGYGRKIEYEDEHGPPASWAQMGITVKSSSPTSKITFDDDHPHVMKHERQAADIWVNSADGGAEEHEVEYGYDGDGKRDSWDPSPLADMASQEDTPPASHHKKVLAARSSSSGGSGGEGSPLGGGASSFPPNPAWARHIAGFEATAGQRAAGGALALLLNRVGGLRTALRHTVHEDSRQTDLAAPASLQPGPPLLEQLAIWAFGATSRSVPLATLAGLACVSVGGVGVGVSASRGCGALARGLLALPDGDGGFPLLRAAVSSCLSVSFVGLSLRLLHGWVGHGFAHQSRSCGKPGRLACCGLAAAQRSARGPHRPRGGDACGGACGRVRTWALASLTARGRLCEALVAATLAGGSLVLALRLALALAAALVGASAAAYACGDLEAFAVAAASSDDGSASAAFYSTVAAAFESSGTSAVWDALEDEASRGWAPLWLPVDSRQGLGNGAATTLAAKLLTYSAGADGNGGGGYGATADAAALSLGDVCGSFRAAADHWRRALGYCLLLLAGQALALCR